MDIKQVKYWKIELFEKNASMVIQMNPELRKPFFTGYANEQIKPEKLHNGEFISLAPSPDSLALHSVRLYRADEIKCTPVYEDELDTFAQASEPLIKWLTENAHPHHHVIVTSTDAALLLGERVHRTEKYLKD